MITKIMMKYIWNVSLSFVGGFVDTATFVAVIGIFSSHVTGNFVLFASSLVHDFKLTDLLKLLVFPVFIFSVALATYLSDRWRKQNKNPDFYLVSTVTIILFICTISSWFTFGKPVKAGSITSTQVVLAMLVVFAMGLQNAIQWMKEKPDQTTTVMTGNVAKLMIELTRLSQKNTEISLDVRKQRLKEISSGTLAFLIGCISAAYTSEMLGLVSLIIPTLVLTFLVSICPRSQS